MKPIDVFDRLFGLAYSQCSFRSLRRPNANKGKPGELLSYLSEEERAALKNLSSNDIADINKLPRGIAELCAYPDSYSWQIKCAEDQLIKDKMEFDKKIIKNKLF